MLEVIDPGLLATVQDHGRPDAAEFGVPRAGACDPLALSAANLLLGDDPTLPAIELTGGLPELRFHEDAVIAVAGADLGLRAGADGAWIRPGTSVLVRGGTHVRAAAAPRTGLRTYIALPGGVDVPRVLGSASTSPVGGFGGLGGRPLCAGDVVRPVDRHRRTGAGHAWPGPGPASGVPRGAGTVVLAVTDGPHRAKLPSTTESLLSVDWLVDGASDRVGLRLTIAEDAARPPAAPEHAIESFALTWGAVEVPQDGAPIIVMPDGPTVGGYPVPLVVASADLPQLGQVRPGDRLRFRYVAPAQARADWLAAAELLREARTALAVMRSVW